MNISMMHNRKAGLCGRIVLLCLASFLAGCGRAPKPASWPTTGWQTSTPEEQGMDSQKLADMLAAIESQGLSVDSVLVVRNGSLVLEAYYDPYGPDDVHSIESNTKSVIAALIGIAIDQGSIEGSSAKMLDFFPGRLVRQMDARKEAITLRHLLSMTPGMDCEDLSEAAQGMYSTPHWVQYLLDLPMIAKPGAQWTYCSGAAHLLSAILQQATGMDARSYANQFLFEPLGIAAVTEQNWAPDPDGVSNGIAGLYLTPRDLAKLGYLYLHEGQWAGVQVVPQAWMKAATREQAYIGPDEYVGGLDRRFGYMFSIFPDQHMYGYLGRAGQELFVIPDKNLVVVFTASLEVGKEASLVALMNDYIVPAAESEQELPPNAAAQQQLAAIIEEASGAAHPTPPLPQTALDISGAIYTLDENPFGWPDMAFSFEPASDQALLRMSGLPELAIGLDGRYRRSAIPGTRPIGLRGAWQEDGRFLVDYVMIGDFSSNKLLFSFDGDRMTVTVENLNFPGQPVTLQGTRRQ
jgi:CubicO group peptidase (beta-lactamase class C family)